MLKEVGEKLAAQGWRLVNIDATVIAEAPKLAGFFGQMRWQLSGRLGIDLEQVSVKASTANGLGLVGKGEGIAAIAVALIEGRE